MKIYNDDYYYEDERLYSTGNDDLDDLLERAFCDGYEYAQKEFGVFGSLLNKSLRNQAARTIKAGRRTMTTLSNPKTVTNFANRTLESAGMPINGQQSYALKTKMVNQTPGILNNMKSEMSTGAQNVQQRVKKGGSIDFKTFLRGSKELGSVRKDANTLNNLLTGKTTLPSDRAKYVISHV